MKGCRYTGVNCRNGIILNVVLKPSAQCANRGSSIARPVVICHKNFRIVMDRWVNSVTARAGYVFLLALLTDNVNQLSPVDLNGDGLRVAVIRVVIDCALLL